MLRFPVSFSQQRLWFLDQLSPDEPTYLMPYAMWLLGPLDASALQRAMDALVARHASLRTSIVAMNASGLLFAFSLIAGEVPAGIEALELSEEGVVVAFPPGTAPATDRVSASDLAGVPLATPRSGSAIKAAADEFFSRAGERLRRRVAHERRAHDLLDAGRLSKARVRIVHRDLARLHGDLRELLLGRTVIGHAAAAHEGPKGRARYADADLAEILRVGGLLDTRGLDEPLRHLLAADDEDPPPR